MKTIYFICGKCRWDGHVMHYINICCFQNRLGNLIQCDLTIFKIDTKTGMM
jgi:hypothetical protein